jgi:hypothetical protein
MVNSPLWFEISIGWFILIIISALVRYFKRDKYVQKIVELPTKSKAEKLKIYEFLLKIYRFLFWVSPLYIVTCFMSYKYVPAEFFHITILIIMMYLVFIEEFIYRKNLIKKIKQN